MHRQLINKPEYNLKNSDITGSKPKTIKFKTNRITNPITPTYNLPSYEKAEYEVPKFIRDNIQVTDISGTRPKALHNKLNIITKTNYLKDIDKSHPTKEYKRKYIINTNDVKDINEYRIFKTNRRTNPLNPEYKFQNNTIGKIEKNVPKLLHKHIQKEIQYNLDTKDIEGSKPSSTQQWNLIRNSKTVKNILNNNDIPSTRPGSLKKGINTNRIINPLNPKYKYLTNLNKSLSNNIFPSTTIKTNAEKFNNYLN